MSESHESSSLPAALSLFPTLMLFGALLLLAIPTAILCIVFALPFNRRSNLMCLVAHRFAGAWCWLTLLPLRLLGLASLKLEGVAQLRGFRGVLIVNHQSQLDIIALLASFTRFRWVSKESMFKIPLLGWAMYSTGYIGLKRDEAASIRQMIADCRKSVADGMPVLIFPEGTRTKDGKLLPFKVGAFSIANKLKAPIAMLTIEGSYAALPPKAILLRRLPRLKVTLREIMTPEEFAELKTKQLCAAVEAKYHAWLDESVD